MNYIVLLSWFLLGFFLGGFGIAYLFYSSYESGISIDDLFERESKKYRD